ncbi:cell wall metabolism sensor histidine kinase WalK [uncultured Oscillibacter sp.]|uniref:sensor histidine kinase n=1 Tax=uncultured Oscillibacter sp. TaxID=876091 RepID=UPI0026220F74|nr:HAMP domain-containing sensor histidine kinase [uncultured Oscillibacter sp.]
MIRKLRLKFVAVCMAMVTAVMAVVLFAVFASVERNIEELSRQVLRRVIQEERPARAPEIGVEIGGGKVLLPYFTVSLWPGGGGYTAYVTGGTYADLEDTEELEAVLRDCMDQQRQEGVVSRYGLRYLRQDNGLFSRLAFVDMSMEQAMLREMMGSYLRIAAAAFTLLLGVSILLAWWATHPVERAWRQQRQFLSDASHELKTPLTVILSNAELLEALPLEARPARWRDNILSEARQMKTLVEEMLTLARADNMTQAAVLTEVSLSDAAEDCALSFEPVAFEAGKALDCEVAGDILVLGDRDKLRRLISILLDNAVKYSRAGGTVVLTLRRTERQARLTVSNPGEPIPPEQLPRLFERFYRADASRGEQSGFGLGLSIAAAIAAEHRGTLRAESDAESTRFIFAMPLKK